MPGRRWVAVVYVLGVASVGRPADGPGRPPADLPPLGLTTASDGMSFPSGTPVSQPLQPVQFVESPPVVTARRPGETQQVPVEEVRPLGRAWETLEYLVWWPKGQPLPPLVTSGRGRTPPVVGGPSTVLLVGGAPIDTPDVSGARFTLGYAVNETETVGLAVTYLFLGSRTSSATVAGSGSARGRFVGRPIVNAITGKPDVIPVAVPGAFAGLVEADTTTRVTGWEINGIANLYAGPQVRLNALAGYRYFLVNEGLRVEQTNLFPPAPGQVRSVLTSVADQFDAHNRFHGGQLGLTADLTNGPVFVEATGKVALGESIMVVRVSGQTVAVPLGLPPRPPQFFTGGVLGQPTNSGRFARSAFAVLPEATVKVGCRFRDRSRFYVGYNFLYLSEAVRPGDQVDPTVDPSQVPLLGRSDGGVVAARPAPVLESTDFWVQGLIFGLEYRY
ncbi:MAG TPA: BBP7 family outer membrane beta-barrel protein [Fimbriiglobus sp.]|nr:BBP7 family outer membrane beta-barrel protein [Fimbriiglobus sp.]